MLRRRAVISLIVFSLAAFALAQPPALGPQPSQILKGHTETIYTVAVSPDGKFTATGSFDKTIKLWDETGKEVRSYSGKLGHTNLVIAVAFSRDGASLASASSDNTVKIWDVPTGKPFGTLEQTANVSKIATSTDGKLIAVGQVDGSIRLWTSADNKPTFTLAGHRGAIAGLVFSGNSQTLYSAGTDKTLRYWNTIDGKAGAVLGIGGRDVNGLTLNSQTGQLITSSSDGSLRFWPAAVVVPKSVPALTFTPVSASFTSDGNQIVILGDDKKFRTLSASSGAIAVTSEALPAGVQSVAVAQTGTLFAAATPDGKVHVSGPDGKLKTSFVAHEGGVATLAFPPNSSSLMTTGTDGTVRVWPTVPQASKLSPHPDKVTAALLLSDGKRILVGSPDKTLRLMADGKIEKPFAGHEAGITAVAEGTGGTLLSADANGTIYSWVPATGAKTAAVPAGPKAAIKMLIPQPGTAGFAAVYASGEVRFRPVLVAKEKDKTQEPKTLPHPAAVLAATFSTDGKKLLTISADKSLRTWNLETGKVEATVPLITSSVQAAGFSPDKTKVLLAASESGKFKLILRPTTADGKPLWEIPLPRAAETVAFSTSGTRLLVSLVKGNSRSVRVHESTAGRELQIVTETAGPVTGLAMLADNKTAFVASDDKTLGFHDTVVTAGTNVGSGNASSIAIHPTTGHLYLAGADKTVRVWDPATQKEIKTFGPLAAAATTLGISRDGTTLAVASGKAIQAWTIADGKELPFPALPTDVQTLVFGPDKSKLLVGLKDQAAWVYDLPSGRAEQFVAAAGQLVGVNFHPQTPTITTVHSDKTLVATPFAIVRGTSDPALLGRGFAVMPNGAPLLVSGTANGGVALNSGTSAKEKTFAVEGPVAALAGSRNNLWVAAAHGHEPAITVFNFAEASRIGTFKTLGKVVELAYHPSNQSLLGRTADNKLYAWNVALEAGQPPSAEFGKLLQEYPHTGSVQSFSILGDGTAIITGSNDKLVRQWKFTSDAPARTLTHPQRVDCVTWDKTGTLVATGCVDGNLRIWDISKAQPTTKVIPAHIQAMPQQPQPIYAVVWSPDGSKIATGSFDKSIKIWDAAAGTLVKELKAGQDRPPLPMEVRSVVPSVIGAPAGLPLLDPPSAGHLDQVYSLSFSPDGKTLASGSSDRTVKLWNPLTGEVLRTFQNPNLKASGDGTKPSHPGFVQRVQFSADGQRLLSVGTAPRNGGYLAVWSVADGKLIAGLELPYGPIYSAEFRPDGSAILGCGPKIRNQTESEAVVLPLNGK